MKIKPTNLVPRREFVRQFVAAAATSVLGSRMNLSTVVAQIAESDLPSGVFHIRLSDFPALQKNSGSVRLGINRVSGGQPAGGNYPILINRESASVFHALDSECTHASCVVGVYNAGLSASVCPCHASRFAIDGRRISGPASDPLRKFQIMFDGQDVLSIEIPNLGFSVTGSSVIAGAKSRLMLSFPSTSGAEHEVLFRERFDLPWAVAKFATTLEGVADKSFVAGNDRVLKVYVDRASESGFYAVTIKVKAV